MLREFTINEVWYLVFAARWTWRSPRSRSSAAGSSACS
jgi:hypothetical protein